MPFKLILMWPIHDNLYNFCTKCDKFAELQDVKISKKIFYLLGISHILLRFHWNRYLVIFNKTSYLASYAGRRNKQKNFYFLGISLISLRFHWSRYLVIFYKTSYLKEGITNLMKLGRSKASIIFHKIKKTLKMSDAKIPKWWQYEKKSLL